MATRQVIVDGSNLATEGRNMPSLEQLDQAVREFIAENPDDVITVVVDASFGHRIDPAELPTFEAAEEAGELISPPAGAIGRGDAFLLRIAEKIGATVLSNDSFQEFHGEHPWLFEKGRLVGGKPVPGVGWIFMDRTPVRGAKSREVVKEAKRRKRAEVDDAPKAADKVGRGEGKGARSGDGVKAKARPKAVDRAIARATEEVVEPKAGAKSRRRRSTAPPSEPVNEPLAFITFIAAHPLGSEVEGLVAEYSSHGAFVDADGARCYVPLSAMGEPPPRRAREVVTRGETSRFVVQAFDPQRRGVELALPGFARIAGGPTAETVEAEITGDVPKGAVGPAGGVASVASGAPAAGSGGRRRRKAPAEAAVAAADAGAGAVAPAEPVVEPEPTLAAAAAAPARRRRRAAGKEEPPTEAAGAEREVAAGSDATPAPPARRTATRKAPARKAPPVPQEAVTEAATEPAPAAPRRAPARRSAAAKAPAAKVPAAKAPAAKAPAAKATASKAPATKAPAAKASASKAAPVKATAAKATAAKATAAKAPTARKARAGNAPAEAAPKAAAERAPAAEKAPPAKKAPAARKAPAAGQAAPAKKAPARKAPATDAAAPTEAAPAARAPARKASARKATQADAPGGGNGGDEPASRRPRKDSGRSRSSDPGGEAGTGGRGAEAV